MNKELHDLYGPEATDDRPSWDAYHMATAQMISERASCRKRLKVGAVVVKDKRQIATGYNGAPPGEPTCVEVGCLLLPEKPKSCSRVNHAEKNSLSQLDDETLYEGTTIYVNYYPCLMCMADIAEAKVSRVVYWKKREDDKLKHGHDQVATVARLEKIKLEEISAEDKVAIIKLLKDKYESLFQDLD